MHLKCSISRSICILSIVLHIASSSIDAYSINGSLMIGPQRHHGKYTIDDLINRRFEYKVSDDIDMDPCKSSMFEFIIMDMCVCLE